jgi:hypothetical protein
MRLLRLGNHHQQARRAVAVSVVAFLSFCIGCRENSLTDRSLVFFTGTTLGLEASVNPSDANGPARIVIGYRRGEGVLNPVYHSNGVEGPLLETTTSGGVTSVKPVAGEAGPIRRYRDQAYSVIAKFSGEGTSAAANAAKGKLSVAQWFATGLAAETLARQPGIAGAVTGSAEIAEATAGKAVRSDLTGLNETYVLLFLEDIAGGLKQMASPLDGSPGDEGARSRLEKLDALAMASTPAVWLDYQSSNDAANVLTITETARRTQPTLEGMLQYTAGLKNAISMLKNVPAGLIKFKGIEDQAAVDIPINGDRSRLTSALERSQSALATARAKLASDPSVMDAVEYFISRMTVSNGR